jgi:hypothetical protein
LPAPAIFPGNIPKGIAGPDNYPEQLGAVLGIDFRSGNGAESQQGSRKDQNDRDQPPPVFEPIVSALSTGMKCHSRTLPNICSLLVSYYHEQMFLSMR